MNLIVRFLKESKVITFLRILNEVFYEAYLAAKHLSGSGMSKSSMKLLTPIVITTHALEKGMSIGSVRPGFGKDKAFYILQLLRKYINANGVFSYVEETCEVLNKYIAFNKQLGADMSLFENSFIQFCKEFNVCITGTKGGILEKARNETESLLNASFDIFSQSRFSIRDFGKSPIDKQAIRRALKLCERTPSACNRQRWSVYVYESEEEKNKICSLQGGAKGFFEDMQAAILICGDLRGYGINELHQSYVDGGLYAMNLLYSLHYEGIAAIPLTMGHKLRKTQQIKHEMGISEFEIPVLLIGLGTYKDNYRVAVSERKSYKEYCTFK